MQSSGHCSGDFILRYEDVINLPIVRLRPKLKAIVHLGQFRGDAYMIALAAHTAFKNIRHAELTSHIT